MKVIFDKWNIPMPNSLVYEIDKGITDDELSAVLGRKSPKYGIPILPTDPKMVEERFIERFAHLYGMAGIKESTNTE